MKQNNIYDFVIIGSGFGGSVSAMRLTEKGYSVLVLERGKRFEDRDFPKTNWNLPKYLWLPALRFHGIFEMTFMNGLLALHGSGVGGGSLMYGNVLIEPDDRLFAAPSWRHLNDWKRELQPHYVEAIAQGIGQATRLSLTFGVFFFDYDLDGWPDILAANGHIEEEIGRVQPKVRYRQPPLVFRNLGPFIVQANVEDTRLGSMEYVIEKHGVEVLELKWGQGAKDIGGEVKLKTLERALQLKERDYIVLPDPRDKSAQEAFKLCGISEFERHSRLGMVTEEGFYKEVERLRKLGAKYVTLKTGAYRPVDLARAVKFASDAKIDLLTVDGAGGGTGMSPWRMMNEWCVPTVYIECLLYEYLNHLKQTGKFVPDLAIAGDLSLEDHVYKAIALGAPYVKLVCMGRSIMTAAMVGNTVGKKLATKIAEEGRNLQDAFLENFAEAGTLKAKYGKDFKRIPAGAIGNF